MQPPETTRIGIRNEPLANAHSAVYIEAGKRQDAGRIRLLLKHGSGVSIQGRITDAVFWSCFTEATCKVRRKRDAGMVAAECSRHKDPAYIFWLINDYSIICCSAGQSVVFNCSRDAAKAAS